MDIATGVRTTCKHMNGYGQPNRVLFFRPPTAEPMIASARCAPKPGSHVYIYVDTTSFGVAPCGKRARPTPVHLLETDNASASWDPTCGGQRYGDVHPREHRPNWLESRSIRLPRVSTTLSNENSARRCPRTPHLSFDRVSTEFRLSTSFDPEFRPGIYEGNVFTRRVSTEF